MTSDNERLAVIETKVALAQDDLERLGAGLDAHRESFAEIKESLIHLRSSAEYTARTQEALASRVNGIDGRVGSLESTVAQNKSDSATAHVELCSSIERVEATMKAEKNRVVAWFSGVAVVSTSAWAVFGDAVRHMFH